MNRTSDTIRTLPNTGSVPTASAIAPSGGPSRAPATAIPSSVPIVWPRRSRLSVSSTHVNAPDQVIAPATPCRNRDPSSTAIWSAKPNDALERPISTRPTSTVTRGPARAAMNPAGSAATRVPAG